MVLFLFLLVAGYLPYVNSEPEGAIILPSVSLISICFGDCYYEPEICNERKSRFDATPLNDDGVNRFSQHLLIY